MEIEDEYPKIVFRTREEALEWLKTISEGCLKMFVELFLRHGEAFPFPDLSVHHRYPGDVLVELLFKRDERQKDRFKLDVRTRERIKAVLNELLNEFNFEHDPHEYLFNLIIVTADLPLSSENRAHKKNIRRPLDILCELAERGKLYETGAHAHGEDLHFFLLRALFSLPIHQEDKGRILTICKKYIGIVEYAPLCYRQIFEMYPEEGLNLLPKYLKLTHKKDRFDYMLPIEIFFNKPDAADIIWEDIRKDGSSMMIKSILPLIIELGREKDFQEAGLMRIENLVPPFFPDFIGDISIEIMASSDIIHFKRQENLIHVERRNEEIVLDRKVVDSEHFYRLFDVSNKSTNRHPLVIVENFDKVFDTVMPRIMVPSFVPSAGRGVSS
ncbi:MAG: hypothetical protein HXS54_08455 [Theionarchaea archaeon]|nr:hypothetical protein [Theionarchaea archaeon]